MFLSTDLVLKAYEKGLFPMSDSIYDPYIYWVEPKERGIIYLNEFKISKSLSKELKKGSFVIKFNSKFKDVINLCAKNKFRDTSWINKQIIDNYIKLHELGYAKSIECFHDNKIIGGLYGIIIGKIFCGESMFSLKKNASKIAMTYLAAALKQAKFKYIDTQFYSDHLKQFGTKKISRKKYQEILKKNASEKKPKFPEKLDKLILEYFK